MISSITEKFQFNNMDLKKLEKHLNSLNDKTISINTKKLVSTIKSV